MIDIILSLLFEERRSVEMRCSVSDGRVSLRKRKRKKERKEYRSQRDITELYCKISSILLKICILGSSGSSSRVIYTRHALLKMFRFLNTRPKLPVEYQSTYYVSVQLQIAYNSAGEHWLRGDFSIFISFKRAVDVLLKFFATIRSKIR